MTKTFILHYEQKKMEILPQELIPLAIGKNNMINNYSNAIGNITQFLHPGTVRRAS